MLPWRLTIRAHASCLDLVFSSEPEYPTNYYNENISVVAFIICAFMYSSVLLEDSRKRFFFTVFYTNATNWKGVHFADKLLQLVAVIANSLCFSQWRIPYLFRPVGVVFPRKWSSPAVEEALV